MSSGTVSQPRSTFVHSLGRIILAVVTLFGSITLFAAQMTGWIFRKRCKKSVLLPLLYEVGVLSIPVVLITGGFIGMVLAVQSFDQLRMMRLETRLGSVINVSLVKELGPVLAATMLAGRVGSSMAAQLGTMRVTEQIDALKALGANPIQYLVVPRFLACFLLIPLLTILADAMGMFGGWLFSTQLLGINSFHYWHHTYGFLTAYDILSGLFKSVFFGAAIAIISCHRGFHCEAGAEGVGKAATEAFVLSFVAILILDFFLGIFLNTTYYLLWPTPITLV
ncbi:Phospholipid ABC transporter permease protein MlaE [hydrothermal vent metagenome]|uniref:Phospholipid ABC transporter permease protein MlaE n=1 Tax=hydrothermal vent metagenome TaxID=652676 RepID=A0A3B1DHW1_9ZZZZ